MKFWRSSVEGRHVRVWQEASVVGGQGASGADGAIFVERPTPAYPAPSLHRLIATDPGRRRHSDEERHKWAEQYDEVAEEVEGGPAVRAVDRVLPTQTQLGLVKVTRHLHRRRDHVEHRENRDLGEKVQSLFATQVLDNNGESYMNFIQFVYIKYVKRIRMISGLKAKNKGAYKVHIGRR